jgi:N-acylglucosamine-6-phosphate 2-epimerase
LPLIRRLSDELDIPVIAEGGIWSPEQLRAVFDHGAFAAVVGSAITRPMLITRRFVEAIMKDEAK